MLLVLSKIDKLVKRIVHWLLRYETNSNKYSWGCGDCSVRPLRVFVKKLESLPKLFSSIIYQVGAWLKGLMLLAMNNVTKFWVGSPYGAC